MVATSGVVLAAAYMLWMFRRVMFGPVDNPENRKLIDLDLREKVGARGDASIPIVWIGVYPDPLLAPRSSRASSALLQRRAARDAALRSRRRRGPLALALAGGGRP